MQWQSPWGMGFPGWHIECSAMSNKYLGKRFDLHGGGMDLAATHHTNEIAQNEACFKESPAQIWMHTNMLTVNGTRMSKSLGNAIYLSDDAKTVEEKVQGMYTDPKRLKATDPGTVENNPLWIYHQTFNPDQNWVAEHADLYRAGKVGDVAIKRKLVEVLNDLLAPMRERYSALQKRPDDVMDALRIGTRRANIVAEETLALAKKAMHQDFFPRTLTM